MYFDAPITSGKEDLFHRGNFAKLLAKSLLNLNNDDTFTVGLFGKWGSGKTSLVNMMIDEIATEQSALPESQKLLIVHFDPWNFSDSNQLLTQFFVRLSNAFKIKSNKDLSKIGKAIEKYSGAFEMASAIPYVGTVISYFGKIAASKIGRCLQKNFEASDVIKQKEYVIELLKNQPNHILIVIDDIDRLSNEQIRQIFQLVSSVAKFPKTTYLLAFDREIVVNALKKVQEGNGDEYLEKIIQMPIQIPEIPQEDLRKTLFLRLDTIVNKYNISFDSEHWQKAYQYCTHPFIKNIRDVNRLCNEIQFKLSEIAPEVDFSDMVAISVIELKFPELFNWIKANKGVLTGSDFLLGLKKKSQQEWYEIYKKEIEQLLIQENHLTDNTLDDIIISLAFLFPSFGNKIGKLYSTYDPEYLRRNNLIAHHQKFDRYFDFNVEFIKIKKYDLENVINIYSTEEIKALIRKLDKEEVSYEFFEELKAVISKLPSSRIPLIIKALIAVSGELKNIYQGFLPMSARYRAELILLDLLSNIPENDRLSFFTNIINESTKDEISVCASLINSIELSYGRLSANGEERTENKILALEELLEAEKLFFNKCETLLEKEDLFSFRQWENVVYLLEHLDQDYIQKYMNNALQSNNNILSYITRSVGIWAGTGTSYEIKDTYTKYLTKERVLEAINAQKESGDFFLLDKETQNKCCAFYLKSQNIARSYDGNVLQADVDELLMSWQN